MFNVIQQSRYNHIKAMLYITSGVFLLFMVMNALRYRFHLAALDLLLVVIGVLFILKLKKVMLSKYTHIFCILFTIVMVGLWLIMNLFNEVGFMSFLWIFAIPVITYLINGVFYGSILTSIFVSLSTVEFYFKYRPQITEISIFSWINVVAILLTVWLVSHFYEKNNTKTKVDLVEQTGTDQLTELKNRTQLYEMYQQCKEKIVCMVVLNIENLRNINIKYGHLAGDVLIITTAKIMSERKLGSAQVFRTGGDEFAILIPDADCDDCLVMTRDIFADICDCQTVFKNEVIPLEVSMAIACIKSDGNNLDALLQKADTLLKKAKLSETDKIAIA